MHPHTFLRTFWRSNYNPVIFVAMSFDDASNRRFAEIIQPAVAKKKAKVRYRSPYQCRHTYASMMLSSGENILWVSQQMGHKDSSATLKKYARFIESDMARRSQSNQALVSIWSTSADNPFAVNAWGGNRTRTPLAGLRILSPVRLPVPPPRRTMKSRAQEQIPKSSKNCPFLEFSRAVSI